MADDALNFTITANTGDLESSLQSIVAGLQNTATAGEESGAAVSQGMNKAKVATTEAEGETRKFGIALDELGEHARTLEMGLGAMGIAGGEATAKIGGLIDALAGMSKAVPELLLITAALALVVGGLDAVKDAIGEAADMQQAMQQLGAAVSASGADWGENQEAIEKWIDAESIASGIAGTDLVKALNNLMTAGHSLADSEKMVAVAEEVHAAKGKDVESVTQLMIQAENGRAMGLERLDNNLKPLIDSHQKFSVILAQLHKDMGGAMDQENGLNATNDRLHAVIEQVSESIGNVFLPILKNLAVTMMGAILNAEEFGKGIYDGFSNAVAAISNAAQAAGHFAEAMADFVRGDYRSTAAQFEEATKNSNVAFKDGAASLKGYGSAIMEVVAGQDAYVRGNNAIYNALQAHKKDTSDLTLGDDPIMGKEPKDKIDPGIAEAAKLQEINMDGVTAAWAKYIAQVAEANAIMHPAKDALDGVNKAVSDAERAVKLATTTESENAAQKQLATAKTNELAAAVTLYSGQQKTATAANNAAAEAHKTTATALTVATNNLKNYQEQIKEHGTKTEKDKEETDRLTAAIKDATEKNAAAEAMNAKANETLNKTADALTAAKKAQEDYTDAIAAANAASQRDYEKFMQQHQEEVAELGMTVAQKLAFAQQEVANEKAKYEQLVAIASAGAADQEKILEEAQDKEWAAETAFDNAQIEAEKKLQDQLNEIRKKAQEEATKDVDDFLDGILNKHQSFSTALKSLMTNIEKQYAESLSKMITDSPAFAKLFGGTSNVTVSGNADLDQNTAGLKTLTTNVSTVNSSTNTLNSTLNQTNTAVQSLTQAIHSGSSGLNSQGSDALGLTQFDLGPNTLNALTGSTAGILPGGAMYNLNQTDPTGQGLADVDFAGNPSVSGFAPNTGNTTGSDISGGLELLQGLSAGGSFGETLGGAGSIVGGIFGGPIGSAIGSTLGSLLGGLFGPKVNAQNNPDIDAQGFGQFEADLFGTSNTQASGPLTQDQATTTAFGTGISGSEGIEELLAKGPAAFEAATGLSAAAYASDLALFGANANPTSIVGGILTPTANVGILEGSAPGASGEHSWQDYQAALAAAEQGLSATGADSPTRVYGITHSMPDFEQTTISQIGTFLSKTGVYSGVSPTAQNPNGTTSSSSSSQPLVSVTIQGNVVGQNGMSQLTATIEEMLIRNRFNNAGNQLSAF